MGGVGRTQGRGVDGKDSPQVARRRNQGQQEEAVKVCDSSVFTLKEIEQAARKAGIGGLGRIRLIHALANIEAGRGRGK